MRRYMLGLLLVLIGLGGATFLSSVFEIHSIDGGLFGEIGEVFAQGANDQEIFEESASKNEIGFASFMQKIVQAMYLLMWPLLAVAGAALDNSLVYGDRFFLRPSLRNMRQIMRNFAFFALGAIFLFGILYNLVKGGNGGEKRGFKKLLPKMLIASLLIQASRFMMSALIDLSTIGVYSVGALPINILSQNTGGVSSVSTARFPKPNVSYSLDNTKKTNSAESTHVIYYTCGGLDRVDTGKSKIIPCRTEGNRLLPELDKNGEASDNTWIHWKTKQAGEILSFQKFQSSPALYIGSLTEMIGSISDEYCYMGGAIIKNEKPQPLLDENEEDNRRTLDACYIQHLRGFREENGNIVSAPENCIEGDCAYEYMSKMQCSTLDTMIDSAQGMTGPMYSLYASIFRMAEISLTPNHKGIIEISLEFILKIVIGLALMVPLFTLAVMLVVRAVILRGFIIFLPLLVLARVFELGMGEKLGDKAQWKSLLSLIFMPVLAVFAISMSMVVLTLLTKIGDIQGAETDIMESLGIEREDTGGLECDVQSGTRKAVDGFNQSEADKCNNGEDECGTFGKYCYNLLDITSLCFTDSQRGFGNGILNMVTRLAINMFGIGLMWVAVFAVLKSTAIIGGIAGAVSGFAKTALKNIPMVPVPGMGMTSMGAIGNASNRLQQLPNQIAQKQYTEFTNRFDRGDAKKSAKKITEDMKNLKANDMNGSKQIFQAGGENLTNYDNSVYGNEFYKRASIAGGGAGIGAGLTSMSGAMQDNGVRNALNELGLDKFKGKRVRSDVREEVDSSMNQVYTGLMDRANDSSITTFVASTDNTATLVDAKSSGSQWYIDTKLNKLYEVTHNENHDIKVTDIDGLSNTQIKSLLSDADKTIDRYNGFDDRDIPSTSDFGRLKKLKKGLSDDSIAPGDHTGYYDFNIGSFIRDADATDAQKKNLRYMDIIKKDDGSLRINDIKRNIT